MVLFSPTQLLKLYFEIDTMQALSRRVHRIVGVFFAEKLFIGWSAWQRQKSPKIEQMCVGLLRSPKFDIFNRIAMYFSNMNVLTSVSELIHHNETLKGLLLYTKVQIDLGVLEKIQNSKFSSVTDHGRRQFFDICGL